MMEMGGYLPLELETRKEYYNSNYQYTVWRVNSGRAGILLALMNCKVNKVYIPWYTCQVVEETLIEHGFCVNKYKIDCDFLPLIDCIFENDWIIYVDYFGICRSDKKDFIVKKFGNVIFDNTQAFFSKPIIKDNVFNIYSCRKFFGVCDGAYVVSNRKENKKRIFSKDYSWKRCLYLIKSYEMGTNGAYRDNLSSEDSIGHEIKLMSDFTRKIMGTIDYNRVKRIRSTNYNFLVDKLSNLNELNLIVNDNCSPMIYPLLVHDEELRKYLIENRVYVPQWWKYLIDKLDKNDFEVKLSRYLIPLPIDQRYTINDMNNIVNIIKKKKGLE